MRVLKFILIASILAVVGYAKTLTPAKELKADGAVNDMIIRDGFLIVATDNGSVIRYSLNDLKAQKLLTLDKIKDFMGDDIADNLFSIDLIDGKYLINSDSGQGGFSKLMLMQNGKLTTIFSADDRLSIIKAKFIDSEHIIFTDVGSTLYYYDLKNRKMLYSKSVSGSKCSDFALNRDRTEIVIADESGVLRVLDIKSGKLIKEIKQHLDNVLKVAFEKNWITSGSQDRKAGYYNIKTAQKGFFKAPFWVYATGISPSEKYFAYATTADNTISIYNSDTMSKVYDLKGQKSVLSVIKFLDDNTIFSGSHDDTIMMWKLK